MEEEYDKVYANLDSNTYPEGLSKDGKRNCMASQVRRVLQNRYFPTTTQKCRRALQAISFIHPSLKPARESCQPSSAHCVVPFTWSSACVNVQFINATEEAPAAEGKTLDYTSHAQLMQLFQFGMTMQYCMKYLIIKESEGICTDSYIYAHYRFGVCMTNQCVISPLSMRSWPSLHLHATYSTCNTTEGYGRSMYLYTRDHKHFHCTINSELAHVNCIWGMVYNVVFPCLGSGVGPHIL